MESVLEEVSVSLDTLAAQIRTEHTAVSTALKDSLTHAMKAGDLLIQAKEKVPHGGWLPWLSENCSISERTAQLYMRTAKNRAELEKRQNTQCIADLTLSEAAAMLALSSDLRKLMSFCKQLEDLDDPEDVIKVCVENGVGVVISDPGYNPFAGRSEAEQRGWKSFVLFLATKCGWRVDGASNYVEWLLQRPFQNVAEWLGEEGEKCRKGWQMKPIPASTINACKAFMEQHATLSMPELEQRLEQLWETRDKDAVWEPRRKHRKPRKAAAAA